MNTLARRFAVSTCALFLAAVPAAMAGPKEYEVTGPIVSISDTSIVVQKGDRPWEVGRDASTKGADTLKVGDKVTIHYTMTAVVVEPKPVKGAKKTDAAAPAAAPAASPKE